MSQKNKEVRGEIHVDYVYTTEQNFVLARDFLDFEAIKKEEVIGYDGGKAIVAPKDGVIIFPYNIESPNEDAFILGEEAS